MRSLDVGGGIEWRLNLKDLWNGQTAKESLPITGGSWSSSTPAARLLRTAAFPSGVWGVYQVRVLGLVVDLLNGLTAGEAQR